MTNNGHVTLANIAMNCVPAGRAAD